MAAITAQDQWTNSLRSWGDELKKSNKTLVGSSDAAIQNRTAFNARVTAMQANLQAEADAGASSRQLSRSLQDQRKALLRSGEAAGLSRKQMQGLLKQYGLTPRQVQTLVKATGADNASTAIRRLRAGFKGLPPEVRTVIRASNADLAQKQIRSLKSAYDLTPKQVRTIVDLQDQAAKSGITNIKQLLQGVDKQKTAPVVSAQVGEALFDINSVQGALNGLHDKTITVTTRPVTIGGGHADGGTTPNPGGSYRDYFPTLLAGGEEVISNRYGQADRNRELLKAINANRYADGGTVTQRVVASGRGSTRV